MLTPMKLEDSDDVPSARDKVLAQCGQEDACSFSDVLAPK